jgi:hypothetical protein
MYSKNGMTWVKATEIYTYISKKVQFLGCESAHQEMVTPLFIFYFENTNNRGGFRAVIINFRVTRKPLFLKRRYRIQIKNC